MRALDVVLNGGTAGTKLINDFVYDASVVPHEKAESRSLGIEEMAGRFGAISLGDFHH
jgi:hypothetical protein